MNSDSSSSATAAPERRAALDALAEDLRRVFGPRLDSLVAYGDAQPGEDGAHTLALVDRVTFQDLAACVPLAVGWRRAGLAVPLVLGRDEFRRTLDVFPLEYGEIMAHHLVLVGADPFARFQISESDVRRACELQVKSHLIHLREGFLEAAGNPAGVAGLMAASAPAFQTILAHIERLDEGAAERAGVTSALVTEVANAAASTVADPSALFARYVTAVERLWQIVDSWRS